MKKLLGIIALLSLFGAGASYATSQARSLGVVSASTATFTGGVGLFNITAAQALLLTANTTGQVFFCSDCGASGGKGTVCVSTGSTVANQLVLSTGTVCK